MPQRMLIIDPDSAAPRPVLLTGCAYRIGRDRDADIRLENKNVSGFHCSLLLDVDGVQLVDLDSTNGTFVNKRRITKTALADGDVIKLGDQTLRYEEKRIETAKPRTTSIFRLPEDNSDGRDAALLTALRSESAPSRETIEETVRVLDLYRRNNRLFETIYTLLERVLLVSDRDAAVALLLRELRSLLGCEIATLYLTGERKFGILENDGIEWSDEYPVVSRTVLRSVVEAKQPAVIDQVDDHDGSLRTLVKFKIRSALCFPVVMRSGAVAAAVYCVSRSAGQLEPLRDDVRFLGACSALVAMVLENLEMLEREKRHAVSRAIELEEQRFTPIISRLTRQRDTFARKLGSAVADDEPFGLDTDDNRELRRFIDKAAPTGLPVLVTGETGVGKSMFAKAIHRAGAGGGPFVVIDCTTIPRELLESELFGHEKGAFTGAHARKAGKVKSADGGTLFIDEIGELDIALQAKLLRLIQSGDYEPLGGSETLRSDARLIAATNRDLRAEVAQKRFREDLYYRLNVLSVELPPLRARPDAALRLADRFLERYAPRLNPRATGFTPEAKMLLATHDWPGNVRELENAVMRALVNATGECIGVGDLSLDVKEAAGGGDGPDPASEGLDLKAARERIDRILIARALDTTGRNVSRAAELLNLSRNSLMDLMKKYGI